MVFGISNPFSSIFNVKWADIKTLPVRMGQDGTSTVRRNNFCCLKWIAVNSVRVAGTNESYGRWERNLQGGKTEFLTM